jgi:hypothetical protein
VGQDIVKRMTDNALEVARLRRYSRARRGPGLPNGQRKASPDKLLVHANWLRQTHHEVQDLVRAARVAGHTGHQRMVRRY